MISTSEELLKRLVDYLKIDYSSIEEHDPELIPYLTDYIKEYANFHVKAALQAASASSDDIVTKQCVEDILNSYPESNIK